MIIQIEVALEIPERLPQQCQERYRLAHILAELTFVFLRVTFRGSPLAPCAPATSLLCVSNDGSSKGDAPAFVSPPSPAPSLSPLSSLTHVHRCIGYRNPNWQSLPKPSRLTNLSVYDSRDGSFDPTPSPSPPSSLMFVHRSCIGYHKPNWHSLSKSVRLTNLSVYDRST